MCLPGFCSLGDVIENPRSPRVRAVAKLVRKSRRHEAGMFLIEGPQAVRELLAYWPQRVIDVFVTDTARLKHPDMVGLAESAGVTAEGVSDDVLEQMADTQTPQGVIAVAAIPEMSLNDALGESPQLVVVLDEVRDPGNAGAIIRVADAVGADCVVFAGESVDVYNPKVVRASTGSLFHLPVLAVSHRDDVVGHLRARGVQIFAADMNGEPLPSLPSEVLASATGWIFGNEARGLSPETVSQSDRVVSLPHYGALESLNLATAAAVCLYQSAFAARAHAV